MFRGSSRLPCHLQNRASCRGLQKKGSRQSRATLRPPQGGPRFASSTGALDAAARACAGAVLHTALLVCALAAGADAIAAESAGRNQYKWRDAAGALHYGDSLPAEAAKFGYEVVNPQGIVVRRIERAKTAEEQAAAKTELAKAQALRDEADARARTDAQLLASYPEEADLKHSQQQKLDLLNQQVDAARISLRGQEQALTDQLAHAAEIERSGKTLPEAQAKQLAETQRQVDEQRAALARRESERDRASAKFDGEAVRYRELKAKLAQRTPAQ